MWIRRSHSVKKLRFGGNSAPFSTPCDTVKSTLTFFSRHCYGYQPDDSERLAGYEVYGLDCTPNERDEAETLEDRGSLKTQKDDPVRYGHKYSWLVRLVQWGTSWVAPVDVRRVETSLTDSRGRPACRCESWISAIQSPKWS